MAIFCSENRGRNRKRKLIRILTIWIHKTVFFVYIYNIIDIENLHPTPLPDNLRIGEQGHMPAVDTKLVELLAVHVVEIQLNSLAAQLHRPREAVQAHLLQCLWVKIGLHYRNPVAILFFFLIHIVEVVAPFIPRGPASQCCNASPMRYKHLKTSFRIRIYYYADTFLYSDPNPGGGG